MDQDSETYWCLGAPQAQQRELDTIELMMLRRDVRRELAGAAAWIFLGPALPFSLGLVCFYLGFAGPTVQLLRWVGVGLLGFTFIGVIAGVVAALDRVRRALLLRREVRDPRVATFATTLDVYTAPALTKMLGLRAPPDSGEFHFSVYLATGRVHAVMGAPAKSFVLLTYETVAAKPERRFDLPRRALSQEERSELLRHARNEWLVPVRSGSFAVLLGIFAVSRGPSLAAKSWHAIVAAAFAAAGVLCTGAMLRGLWRARLLRADAAEGFAVRMPLSPLDALPHEVLPLSGTAWTIGDEPAPWRTGSTVERR